MPHAKAQRTRKVGKIFVSVKCQDLVQRDRHNFASPLRLCVRIINQRRCKSRPIWQERAISGHFLFMLIGSILSPLNLTQRRRGLAKEVIFWWVRCLALVKCEPAELAEASPSESAEGNLSRTTDFVTQTSVSIRASGSANLLSGATAHLRDSDRTDSQNM